MVRLERRSKPQKAAPRVAAFHNRDQLTQSLRGRMRRPERIYKIFIVQSGIFRSAAMLIHGLWRRLLAGIHSDANLGKTMVPAPQLGPAIASSVPVRAVASELVPCP
jgi:hypothetical protein